MAQCRLLCGPDFECAPDERFDSSREQAFEDVCQIRLGIDDLTVAAADEREERGGVVNEPTDAPAKRTMAPKKGPAVMQALIEKSKDRDYRRRRRVIRPRPRTAKMARLGSGAAVAPIVKLAERTGSAPAKTLL